MPYRPIWETAALQAPQSKPLVGPGYFFIWPLLVVGTADVAPVELSRWIADVLKQMHTVLGIQRAGTLANGILNIVQLHKTR